MSHVIGGQISDKLDYLSVFNFAAIFGLVAQSQTSTIYHRYCPSMASTTAPFSLRSVFLSLCISIRRRRCRPRPSSTPIESLSKTGRKAVSQSRRRRQAGQARPRVPRGAAPPSCPIPRSDRFVQFERRKGQKRGATWNAWAASLARLRLTGRFVQAAPLKNDFPFLLPTTVLNNIVSRCMSPICSSPISEPKCPVRNSEKKALDAIWAVVVSGQLCAERAREIFLCSRGVQAPFKRVVNVSIYLQVQGKVMLPEFYSPFVTFSLLLEYKTSLPGTQLK